VILDTDGNIFGGFTPVIWASLKWSSGNSIKADQSMKSFLFTLKNPHQLPPRIFRLRKKDEAIDCDEQYGPCFGQDVWVCNNCNARPNTRTEKFGTVYTNDTRMSGSTFFTGSAHCQVKEIEVFAIHS
jgi:hypothetical protein